MWYVGSFNKFVASGLPPRTAPQAQAVESSAGIGFAACAGKHYFVIGTRAAFWRTHANVPSGLLLALSVPLAPNQTFTTVN